MVQALGVVHSVIIEVVQYAILYVEWTALAHFLDPVRASSLKRVTFPIIVSSSSG
jgi:hypothetical protein